MSNSKPKKPLAFRLFLAGVIAWALSLIWLNFVTLVNMAPWDATVGTEHWGTVAGTFWFWNMFAADPGWTGTGQMHWGNEDIWSLIIVTMIYVLTLLVVIATIFAIKGKTIKKVGPSLCGVLVSGWWLGYVACMIVIPTTRGWIWRSAYFEYMVVFVLAAVAFILFAAAPVLNLIANVTEEVKDEKKADEPEEEEAPAGLTEEQVREIVRDELGKAKPEEEKPEEDKGIDEEAVREIVREELSHYEVVEEEKPEPEPEPEPEEEKPEPEEEEPEGGEDAPEEQGEGGPEDPFSKLRTKRRRASFETKLKNSEYDLRHKYYDLRDYIKSYGVKNRISIPGDTFSAHRERLVFLTINGKHIKACFALDPADYADSPIPVEPNTAKKYDGLPLTFKIKSNLSFRRALKLVDDLMAKKGIVKPEAK